MTTGASDAVMALAALRQLLSRRRAGALDRAAKYRLQGNMWASQKFAEGMALAYGQSLQALDDAIGAIDDPSEVTKLNGS